jgi:hypothetical protein
LIQPLPYARHRFPPAVIQRAVRLHLRFTLSWRRQLVGTATALRVSPGSDRDSGTSRGQAGTRDLGPSLEDFGASGAILGGGDVMAAEEEEVGDLVMGRGSAGPAGLI